MEYVGSLPTGAKFFHYRLDISGDLDSAVESMVDQVTAVMSAAP